MRYGGDLTLISSVFRGDNKYVPKELYPNEPKIPQLFQVRSLTQHEQSTQNSSNTFTISLKHEDFVNHGSICPVARFKIPSLVMNSPSDFFRYCSLPALQLFNNVSLFVDGKIIEQLTPVSLEIALKKFLQSNFEWYAEKWLGGINGPNQMFSCAEHYDSASCPIKEEIECLVPLPFCLFRNERPFPTTLSKNTPITIVFSFNQISKIVSFGKQYLNPNTLSNIPILEFFLCYTVFNERVFNNLPYVDPDVLESAYLVEDKYLQTTTKQIKSKNDHVFNINGDPLTEYFVNISNDAFNIKNYFLGKNNEDCRANWWASLFTVKRDGINTNASFSLKTAKFLSGLSEFQNYKIVTTKNPKKIILRFELAANVYNDTIISSDLDFDKYPEDLLINLKSWNLGESHCGVRPEYFSSVHFNVEPFDENNLDIREDVSFKNSVMTLLDGGLFTFESEKTKYAFMSITGMKKSRFINQAMYDILPCMPISTFRDYSPNIFISFKFVRHILPNHPFYDLDGKYPIKVKEYVFNSKVDIQQKNTEAHIELERQYFLNKTSKYLNSNFQIHKCLELIRGCESGSNGFETVSKSVNYELVDIKLRYYSSEPSLYAILDQHLITFTMTFVQSLFRFLKFYPNSKTADQCLTILTSSEASVLAEDVLENETNETGVFSTCHDISKYKREHPIVMGNFKRVENRHKKNRRDVESEGDSDLGTDESIKRFKNMNKN